MELTKKRIPQPTVYGLPFTVDERNKLHKQRKQQDLTRHDLNEPILAYVGLDARDRPLSDLDTMKCHLAYLQTWCKNRNNEELYHLWTNLVLNNLQSNGYTVKLK